MKLQHLYRVIQNCKQVMKASPNPEYWEAKLSAYQNQYNYKLEKLEEFIIKDLDDIHNFEDNEVIFDNQTFFIDGYFRDEGEMLHENDPIVKPLFDSKPRYEIDVKFWDEWTDKEVELTKFINK